MAIVIISPSLKDEVLRTFKRKAKNVFRRMQELEEQPNRGKKLANVEGIIIKEIKQESHRFYFITDGHTLKFGSPDELSALIIKFVKMSKKNDQQQAIDNIKNVLKSLGFEGF